MDDKKYGIKGVIALIAWFSASVTLAQPHGVIALVTTPVTKGDRLTGLKMRWTMDEMTSADLWYEAGNAKPGSLAWKRLAADVMANVQEQHYFTELWRNGEKVEFTNKVSTYGLRRVGQQAVLTFVLPLAHPQELKGQRFRFATFDPAWLIDMHYSKVQDVRLPKALAERCEISVITPQPGEEKLFYAVALDEDSASAEEMEPGKQSAQQVILQC